MRSEIKRYGGRSRRWADGFVDQGFRFSLARLYHSHLILEAGMMKIVAAPAGLSAASKDIWNSVQAEWVLDCAQQVLLQTALEAYDRMQQAKAQVDGDGITVTTASGLVKPHPSLRTEKEAGSRFLQAWRQIGFGLDPPAEAGRPVGG